MRPRPHAAVACRSYPLSTIRGVGARTGAPAIGRRTFGLFCSGFGFWCLVSATAGATGLSRLAQAVLGVWGMSAGIGLLLAPAPLLQFARPVKPEVSDRRAEAADPGHGGGGGGGGTTLDPGAGMPAWVRELGWPDAPQVRAVQLGSPVGQGGWLDVLDLAEIAAKVYAETPEIGHSAN
jgi:hypothetical protein